MPARHDQEGATKVCSNHWNEARQPACMPLALLAEQADARVALGRGTLLPPQNRSFRMRVKRGAGWPPSPTPPVHVPPLGGLCPSLPSPGAQRQTSSHSARALEQKGEVELTFIFRPSCLKAFTPSPPLTPLPCRIDSGCDMVQVISRRCNAPFVRRGAGKNEAKGSCAGGWPWDRATEKALLQQECAAVLGELKSSSCCQVARMAVVRRRPGKSGCL